MTGLVRDPLLHFFVLAAMIFGLFFLFDDTPPPKAERRIAVTEDDARRLAAEFQATWRRPPNVAELTNLIEHHVREEIYVREALALGLDRDDAVIRRRLQMKMEFLTEAGAGVADPDDATLEAHLGAHPERFIRAPLVAFEQILLDSSVENSGVREIRASLNRGRDPVEVARPSLLPAAFPASPQQVIDGTFGAGFFDAVADLPVGEWAGPVTTTLGRHLVRVTDRREGRLPPLAEIRDQVVQDWRAMRTTELRDQRFEAMRARYEITFPDAAEVLDR